MLLKHNRLLALLCSAPVCMMPLAHAQFAVIDVASINQLVQQVHTLQQQLEAAQTQVAEAQMLYQSTTGNRGMAQLLSGVTRNYLPSSWSQLTAAMQGAGSPGSLGPAIQAAVASNAVLSSSQLASLSAAEQSQIAAARGSGALLQALAQQELANSSGRFADIQQLIGAIGTARDQKGILELQARISAEQDMLQNEQTKLQVLYQAAQAQAAVLAEQMREQSVAGNGDFASRFRPTAP